ncbi:MAG: hypothetical protein ACOYBY_15050 [Dermatophilaceae bacterium]
MSVAATEEGAETPPARAAAPAVERAAAATGLSMTAAPVRNPDTPARVCCGPVV